VPVYTKEMEKELLRQIATGDPDAFRVIFEHFWDKVYSSALILSKSPELAEDIAQDIFTGLWVRRDRIVEIENIENWLFITARNKIYTCMRREGSGETYRNWLRQYFDEETFPPNIIAEFKQAEELLHQGIFQMPPQQQRAFRLSRFDGLNHKEIADTMQISPGTVKNYIVKSIAFLRQFMRENGTTLAALICIRLYR
jgi:RNA polymerase sigma-70 factor (family 1)